MRRVFNFLRKFYEKVILPNQELRICGLAPPFNYPKHFIHRFMFVPTTTPVQNFIVLISNHIFQNVVVLDRDVGVLCFEHLINYLFV